MRLYEDIDFTTLTWVKPELDETLRQARLALESFVEDTGDVSQMRYCATYLHQVHGTLRMVELYGAAMVAEEMEQLARSLMDAGDSDRDEAFAVLMRGIVQLPDYLERLQSGHRDIPIVLLPLLNELREARGEKSLGESALFSPDLGRSLPGSAAGPAQPLGDMALREQAERLRSEYQSALLNWLRDDGSDATIGALTEVCDRLVDLVHVEPARRLFWVAGGTLEALRAGSFEASKPLKQALGRVEREIKRIAEQGEDALRRDPPLELTRQLLYYVAHAPTDYGRIREMREVFVLDRYLPSDAELEHARGSMTGHNRALLDTVSSAIKDDLLRVKDALDLHMRGGGRDLSELAAEAEVLDRVGDTLGMLGLGVPRRVVQEQRQALAEVANGQREGDEGTLLDIAGALLYVEASLDDQVAQLGQAPGANAAVAAADQGAASVALAETRKVLEVVTKEAIANFAQARQCFVAFVETGWDSAQLDDVPRLLGEVSGVLRMLELERAPDYLEALRRYTAGQLITHRRVPGVAQLDALADALSALEYFLEAVRDHRGGREGILDTCRDRLESLGCWPLEPAAAAVAEATRAEPATPGPPRWRPRRSVYRRPGTWCWKTPTPHSRQRLPRRTKRRCGPWTAAAKRLPVKAPESASISTRPWPSGTRTCWRRTSRMPRPSRSRCRRWRAGLRRLPPAPRRRRPPCRRQPLRWPRRPASRAPARRSTTRSAKSSWRSSRKRSRTCPPCSRHGVHSRTNSIACGPSDVSSIPSRAAAASSVR